MKISKYNINAGLSGIRGTEPLRMGLPAHKLGHFFGLPNLYDEDQNGAGLGNWGMMANSWGWDNTGYYPPQFSAWSKIQLGWVTPTVVTIPGAYSLAQAETNGQVVRIDTNFPEGDYLLLENRQPVGFDR